MQVTIELPEDVAAQLAARADNVERSVLEATALEGYRCGTLTQALVRRMPGFQTDMEVDAFLKAAGVYLEYSAEDLKRDGEISHQISSR